MRRFEDRYITKHNYEKSKGFYVRFSKDQKIIACKFFSKSKYRTWKNTRRVARAWRTKIEKKLGFHLTQPIKRYKYRLPPFKTRLTRKNTSGTIGVFFDEFTDSWLAFWYPRKGKLKVKRFSAHTHGDAEAKDLAITKRKKEESKLEKLALAEKR